MTRTPALDVIFTPFERNSWEVSIGHGEDGEGRYAGSLERERPLRPHLRGPDLYAQDHGKPWVYKFSPVQSMPGVELAGVTSLWKAKARVVAALAPFTQIPVVLTDPDTVTALHAFKAAAEQEHTTRVATKAKVGVKARYRHWTDYLSDAWAKAGPYNVPMDRRDWPPLQALRNSEGAFKALAFLREHGIP